MTTCLEDLSTAARLPRSHQIGTLSCEIGHLLTMWHIWGNGTVFSLWLIVHVLTLIYTYLSNSIFVLDFASKKLSLSGLHPSDRREDKWVFPGKSRFPLSLLSLTLHCLLLLSLTGLYLSSWFLVLHLRTSSLIASLYWPLLISLLPRYPTSQIYLSTSPIFVPLWTSQFAPSCPLPISSVFTSFNKGLTTHPLTPSSSFYIKHFCFTDGVQWTLSMP